jgi:molecular chaperone DnaK
MDPIIGIDFGTSNSVICEWRDGKAHVVPNDFGEGTTPSVVTLDEAGVLQFGKIAREQFLPGRSIRSIKRVLGSESTLSLGGQELRPEIIAASLFRKLKQDAEARLHAPVTKAVITVPANSKGLQRTATKVCAQVAGLQVLTLINEPTAAAMAYGVDLTQTQNLLVYDFGGGTFDVTILKVHHGLFEELASKGVRFLGGDDIDQALLAWVVERQSADVAAELAKPEHVYWAQRLTLACEDAKIALGAADTATVRIAGFLGTSNLEQVITRADFESLAEPFIAQTAAPLDDALRTAGLLPKDIDRILLVGGTSKIPRVKSFVEAHLERAIELTPGVDPLTCVAEGAAIAAGIIQQAPDLATRDYLVRLEHSLCADPLDISTMEPFLDPIIPRGSAIPITKTHRYYPMFDYAEGVDFQIYEGDVYDDLDHPDNAKLLSLAVILDPPRPTDDAALDVKLSYGDDGILNIEVTDVFHGKVVTQEAVTFAQSMLDEAARERQTEQLDALMPPGTHRVAGDTSEDRLLVRGRKLYAKLDANEIADAAPFKSALDALSAELTIGGDAAARQLAAAALREEMASFAYLDV